MPNMGLLFHIAYGLLIPPGMHFAYHFYRLRGREINFKGLWISITLLFVTSVVTTLQFFIPAIIPLLNRDPEALRAGELWRLVTSAFIQPAGFGQCFFNALFFLAYVPIAEHLYGKRLLIIYFGSTIIGQIVNVYWDQMGAPLAALRGGSSGAIFGTLGSLYMYIVLNKKEFPKGWIFLSVAGFTAAIILCFYKDGHAPSLLTGATLGFLIHQFGVKPQSVHPLG